MPAIFITPTLAIDDKEIELTAIRAQGPGGQNVNKVASAIQLSFDIRASSLPQEIQDKLLATAGRRLTTDGRIIIRAQEFRDQSLNRAEALRRLSEIITLALKPSRPRRPTRPTMASRRKRIERKIHRGLTKILRKKVD
ncbi:MAG: aminoacyl-tRNA hydrolase [Desulfobulbaceae bacterium]|jgi:ribosome-associated protein|nr:aminoacyl-tRNA hydrolase [Desulfobulbaceae bacterium]